MTHLTENTSSRREENWERDRRRTVEEKEERERGGRRYKVVDRSVVATISSSKVKLSLSLIYMMIIVFWREFWFNLVSLAMEKSRMSV